MVCHGDVNRRDVQRPIFAKKGNPLALQDFCPHGIDGNGIPAHQESPVGPYIAPVKEMCSPPIELRGQGAENIQAGFALDNGIGPNFAQILPKIC